MLIEELSPDEVAERLRREQDSVYLDVRTVGEFAQGRPLGALNVPMYEIDEHTRQPRQNPDFLAVVKSVVRRQTTVFCGCASGQRSMHAAVLMRQAGYQAVYNVDAGFSGKHDMLGRTLAPGWAERGHPLASGADDVNGYAALRARAGLADD